MTHKFGTASAVSNAEYIIAVLCEHCLQFVDAKNLRTANESLGRRFASPQLAHNHAVKMGLKDYFIRQVDLM